MKGLPAVLTLLVLAGAIAAQGVPLQQEEWKLDIVFRKDSEPFRGLVTSQTPKAIHINRVFRTKGKPTVVIADIVPRSELAELRLLDDKERALLTARLETLSKERKVLSAQERLWNGGKAAVPPSEMLELKPEAWGADGKGKALAYDSTHFRLVSNAREDIVLLTAIQLEQVFTAYARFLPPRGEASKRTTILLTQSLEEYHELVKARGHNILNPAFFDPKEMQVVCGCDLERLGKELTRVHGQHAKLLEELASRREELKRIYKGQAIPLELSGPIDEAFRKIVELEKKNSNVVRMCHLRLVQCLCHEAFHAYLNGTVFANRKARVPAWLDEGLAQVFETALVEVGELHVGQPDMKRLNRIRTAKQGVQMLPLADLLKSTARQFQVAHTQEKQISDRYYLGAWALGFYLTFEKQVLRSEALDDYLTALERGTDPLEAFSVLTGDGPEKAEKKLHEYLQNLRPDGSVAKK
jgi:hypothetical protein